MCLCTYGPRFPSCALALSLVADQLDSSLHLASSLPPLLLHHFSSCSKNIRERGRKIVRDSKREKYSKKGKEGEKLKPILSSIKTQIVAL